MWRCVERRGGADAGGQHLCFVWRTPREEAMLNREQKGSSRKSPGCPTQGHNHFEREDEISKTNQEGGSRNRGQSENVFEVKPKELDKDSTRAGRVKERFPA